MRADHTTTCDRKGCPNEHTTLDVTKEVHEQTIKDAGWRIYKIIGGCDEHLCKNCAYHKATP